jgi:predicted nucleic acid-binding protein
LLRLDDGERAAIQLAIRISAELVLMDDRAGVAIARSKGFAVTGTLGILDLAARPGLIRLKDAIEALKATNFRHRPEILDALLAEYEAKDKPQNLRLIQSAHLRISVDRFFPRRKVKMQSR